MVAKNTIIGGSVTRRAPVKLTKSEYDAWFAFTNQERITVYPYYSVIRIRATRADSGAGFVYTVPAGIDFDAFSYGVTDLMTGAGFAATDGLATYLHTNIEQKLQTISGQNVLIFGVGAMPQPGGFTIAQAGAAPIFRPLDQQFLAAINASLSWSIAFNGGENGYQLGRLAMIPGGGGFDGSAEQLTGDSALAGDQRGMGYANNGLPSFANRFPLAEGILWRHAGEQDSSMRIRATTRRQIQVFSGGSPESIVGDVAADNDPAQVATAQRLRAFPAELVCDILVWFDNEVIGRRSDLT